MNELKEMLLQAPDSELDSCMFPLIKKWDDTPTAIQVMEVLDHCVHGGLASGFVIKLLETMVDNALKEENLTREQLIEKAIWRLGQV